MHTIHIPAHTLAYLSLYILLNILLGKMLHGQWAFVFMANILYQARIPYSQKFPKNIAVYPKTTMRCLAAGMHHVTRLATLRKDDSSVSFRSFIGLYNNILQQKFLHNTGVPISGNILC